MNVKIQKKNGDPCVSVLRKGFYKARVPSFPILATLATRALICVEVARPSMLQWELRSYRFFLERCGVYTHDDDDGSVIHFGRLTFSRAAMLGRAVVQDDHSVIVQKKCIIRRLSWSGLPCSKLQFGFQRDVVYLGRVQETYSMTRVGAGPP